MVVDDIDNLNYDSLEAVAHLRASDRYREIMQVGHRLVKLFTACALPGLHLAHSAPSSNLSASRISAQ